MSIILRDGTNAGNLAHVDASGNVSVAINGSIAAGSNIIGQVEITDGTNVLGTIAHPMVVSQSSPTDRTATGTINGSPQNISINAQGASSIQFNVTGSWTGTLNFQGSVDGTNWVPAEAYPIMPSTSTFVNSTTTNGQWAITAGGLNAFRLLSSAWVTGTATIWIEAGVGSNVIEIVQTYAPNLQTAAQLYASGTPLTETAGSLNVNITGGGSGDVQYANGTAVGTPTGTVALGFDGANVRALNTDASGQLNVLVQNTPAVTVSGSVAVTQSTTPWVVSLTSTTITGTVAVTQSTSPWVVSGTVAVSGVSGTVAVTQSTSPWVISGNVNQVIGDAGFEQITDGTNTVAVKAASTAPVATDPALVVTISPNSAAITADSSGSGTSNPTAASWTSATSNNTAVAIYNANFSYNTAIITFNQTTTISGGAANFEVSNDNSNWVSIEGLPEGGGSLAASYAFNPNTYVAFAFNISGWQYFRVRLSPAITGTGTVTVGYAVQTTGQPVVYSVEAKDIGRTYVTFFIDAVSGITAEALATMTINRGGSTSSATSYTVTGGKTFRIQSCTVAAQETNTTVQTSKVRLRSATTVSATSPILYGTFIATSGNTNNVGNLPQSFPDGLEIAGGQQIGISHLESSTSSNITVSVVGYEY